MLIGIALGAIVVLVASSALRFFRMDDAVEHAAAAKQERKQVVFEGVLTPRTAKEEVAEHLARTYAGERVKITVERLKADAAPGGPPPP